MEERSWDSVRKCRPSYGLARVSSLAVFPGKSKIRSVGQTFLSARNRQTRMSAPRLPIKLARTPLPETAESTRITAHDAGWSSPVAREAHNLEVAGSNPVPAIERPPWYWGGFFFARSRRRKRK